jgi:predicted  nucleic acid-binding Zn-ribbon protein
VSSYKSVFNGVKLTKSVSIYDVTKYHQAVISISECAAHIYFYPFARFDEEPNDYQDILDKWEDIRKTVANWFELFMRLRGYPLSTIDSLREMANLCDDIDKDIEYVIAGKTEYIPQVKSALSRLRDTSDYISTDYDELQTRISFFNIDTSNMPSQIEDISSSLRIDVNLDQASIEILKKDVAKLNTEINELNVYIAELATAAGVNTGIGLLQLTIPLLGWFIILPASLVADYALIQKIVKLSEEIKTDQEKISQDNQLSQEYLDAILMMDLAITKLTDFSNDASNMAGLLSTIRETLFGLAGGIGSVVTQCTDAADHFSNQDWVDLREDVHQIKTHCTVLVDQFRVIDISKDYGINDSVDSDYSSEEIQQVVEQGEKVDLISYLFPDSNELK